jgi:hypothetical protein
MTDIMSNFTSIPVNASVVEYVFAFDNSLANLPMFMFLLGIMLVIAGGVYLWKRDFVDSFLFGCFISLFSGFLMTLIRSEVFVDASGDPLRLLSFNRLIFFIVVLGLLALYKKVSDR